MTNKRDGFALAFSVVFTALIMLSVTTFLLIATNDLVMSKKSADITKAYYLADAGLANAFMYIRNPANAAGSFTLSNVAYPVGPSLTGSYQVNATYTGYANYTIVSTGVYRGATKKLELKISGVSFSRWAYTTNKEYIPSNVYPAPGGGLLGRTNSYWITGNIVTGPINTNANLYIAGNPVFNGPVTQYSPTITYYNNGHPTSIANGGGTPTDQPRFNQGLTLSAPKVTIPNQALNTSALYEAAGQSGGLMLNGADAASGNKSTSIVLNSNGTMTVTNVVRNWVNETMPLPANGAIFVINGDVKVQGILNGQLTIGCNNNIWINGSIIYHDTSPANPNLASNDLLGLMAQKNVIIPNNAPTNMEVDGSIVAVNGSFYIENCWTAPLKGNLVLFGGTMTDWSATVFGTFTGSGQLATGYNQLQFYDSRLQTLVPLYYPLAVDGAADPRPTFTRSSFKELKYP
jgi:hypothetical protein